eukprot:1359834-Amorphochlora_amoeboformis.AAC.1
MIVILYVQLLANYFGGRKAFSRPESCPDLTRVPPTLIGLVNFRVRVTISGTKRLSPWLRQERYDNTLARLDSGDYPDHVFRAYLYESS